MLCEQTSPKSGGGGDSIIIVDGIDKCLLDGGAPSLWDVNKKNGTI